MKMRRIFTVFLTLVLLAGFFAVPRAAALEEPDIQCQAALLMDAETGAVVYAKNEHQEMYPASLTKIMTCLLTLEAIDDGRLSLDKEITASPSALLGLSDEGSTAGIQAGEILTVEELLYCLMVVSANEASTILAEEVAGSVDAFVESMNAKAEILGCKNTHFVNPHGFHDPRHYSSAWDIYLIVKEALTHPEFLTICDTKSITIPATNLSDERVLHNTNYLISSFKSRGYLNSDAHGIKTGHTSQAGHCLAATAIRGSLSFISVVMNGDRVLLEDGTTWWTYSFGDTNLLYKWAFENFAYQTVLKAKDPVQEVAVSLSKTDYVTVRPASDIDVLLPNELAPEDLERTVTLVSDPVEAPIAAGDVLGTLTLSSGSKEYATVDLLATSDVESSRLQVFLRDAKLFLAQTWVKTTAIVIAALILLFLIWRTLFSRRRYRYGRKSSGRVRGYRGRRHR